MISCSAKSCKEGMKEIWRRGGQSRDMSDERIWKGKHAKHHSMLLSIRKTLSSSSWTMIEKGMGEERRLTMFGMPFRILKLWEQDLQIISPSVTWIWFEKGRVRSKKEKEVRGLEINQQSKGSNGSESREEDRKSKDQKRRIVPPYHSPLIGHDAKLWEKPRPILDSIGLETDLEGKNRPAEKIGRWKSSWALERLLSLTRGQRKGMRVFPEFIQLILTSSTLDLCV